MFTLLTCTLNIHGVGWQAFIRKTYKFTEPADVWFRKEIRSWATKRSWDARKKAQATEAPAKATKATPAKVPTEKSAKTPKAKKN